MECVARGYLAGSGWKDYQRTGRGLRDRAARRASARPRGSRRRSSRRPRRPQSGHDENIDFETVADRVGRGDGGRASAGSRSQCYERGAALAEARGIIVADTKFEFGRQGERLLLVDEVLTPDSSRFWPADRYAPGQSPPSFDKQFVRDWLERTTWDKSSPPPRLPADVVAETRAKYVEALVRLTGRGLDVRTRRAPSGAARGRCGIIRAR